ncbi:MAG: hypothetical protein IT384_09670 [Deltaproteobacteria bacterium]|nr:hypothetical protein [Deltaproteobacteria bacterium]
MQPADLLRGFLGLVLTAAAACGGDPAITSFTVTPATVAPGGRVTGTVVVENFEIGHGGSGLTARRSAAALRAANEGEHVGHLHVYFDTTEMNPLVMTSSTTFPVPIPADATRAAHTLIARLHNADHTIVEPEVKATASITVQ